MVECVTITREKTSLWFYLTVLIITYASAYTYIESSFNVYYTKSYKYKLNKYSISF